MEGSGPIPSDMPVAPPPPGMVSDFSNPTDFQRYNQFIISLAVFATFSTACALARLYTRVIVVRRFGWDDGFAIAAMLLNIGFCICTVGELKYGLAGIDWNIRLVDFIADDSAHYNYYNVVAALIYYLMYACVKLSILTLYLRVIGSTYPKFRIAIYFMIFAVVAIVIGCTADLLSFCQPVTKLFYPETPGTCHVNGDLFFAQSILTVLTDGFILIPPIPIIWKLSSTVRRKIGLTFLLCIGFVVTGISITRTVIVSPLSNNLTYFLWDNFYSAYFAVVEVNLAIAVVSLPALPQLYSRLRLLSSRRSHESPGAGMPAVVELTDNSPVRGSDRTGSAQKAGSGKKKNARSSVSQIAHAIYPDYDIDHDETEIEPIREKSTAESDSVMTAEARSVKEEQARSAQHHRAASANDMV